MNIYLTNNSDILKHIFWIYTWQIHKNFKQRKILTCSESLFWYNIFSFFCKCIESLFAIYSWTSNIQWSCEKHGSDHLWGKIIELQSFYLSHWQDNNHIWSLIKYNQNSSKLQLCQYYKNSCCRATYLLSPKPYK